MTAPRALLLSFVLALVLGLGSCGQPVGNPDGGSQDAGQGDAGRDGGVDAGTPDAGLAWGAACTVFNTRRCEYLRQCGLIAADDDARRDCLAWLTATWCGPSLWPSHVAPAAGTLKYDPVEALGCADGFVGRACADYESLPAACSRFLSPNAYSRQACYDGYQDCTEGVCRGGACPRTCQPRGAAGEVCRLDTDCRTGLFCRVTNTAAGIGLCTAFGVGGASCDSQQLCGPGLNCLGSTCQSPPTEGSACPALICDATAWCQTTPDGGICTGRGSLDQNCSDDVQCLDDLLCDTLRGKCEPRQLTQPGALCGSRQKCPVGTVCLGASVTQLGSCAAPRAEGEPCAVSSECNAHLSCTQANDGGRVCGGRAQAGSPCSFDRDCHVLSRCKLGSCVDLPVTGGSCEDTQECLWGPCSLQGDAGAMCVERYGPGALCQSDMDCASQKCIAGRCLASCSP